MNLWTLQDSFIVYLSFYESAPGFVDWHIYEYIKLCFEEQLIYNLCSIRMFEISADPFDGVKFY